MLGGGAIFPMPPGGGGSGPLVPFFVFLSLVDLSELGIFILIVWPSLNAKSNLGPLAWDNPLELLVTSFSLAISMSRLMPLK